MGTCPYFSKTRTKCPLWLILVTLLEDFEDAKIDRKIHVSSDLRRSKFQNFSGEHAPGPPRADLHLETGSKLTLFYCANCIFVSLSVLSPRQSVQSHFQKLFQVASQSMCPPPTFKCFLRPWIYGWLCSGQTLSEYVDRNAFEWIRTNCVISESVSLSVKSVHTKYKEPSFFCNSILCFMLSAILFTANLLLWQPMSIKQEKLHSELKPQFALYPVNSYRWVFL